MGADSSKALIGGDRRSFLHEGSESDIAPKRHPPLSSRSRSVPSNPGDDDVLADSTSSQRESLQRHRSTMVVVNPGHDSGGGPTKDPLMQKLEELHFFYPLMHDVERRSGIFGTHNRKALADIQAKIESLPALKIVRIYEDRLRRHAETVSTKQGHLSCRVKEADLALNSLFKSYSTRAKDAAKSVDNLSKLDDTKRNLTKCQESFAECVAIVELLNEMLPEAEKLESFDPWTDEQGSECFDGV